MTAEGVSNHPGTRIHAIVLTKNRPETLRRCIAAALDSLGPQDILTILDDSLPSISPANTALLAATPPMSGPTRIHLSTIRMREVITQSVNMQSLLWLSNTAPRDIAPLRNISLLLSVALPAETTVLVDDDIHGFDLFAAHCKISALARAGCGVILGADIGGINEQDTITRLSGALDKLEKLPSGPIQVPVRELFHVSSSVPSDIGGNVRYVSAGYLAFRLPLERIFAFPPGYNEDWLWCLLHKGNAQMQISRSGETVVHDPPSVLKPTREDLSFELIGDIVFDGLEEQNCGNNLNPEARLTCLSTRLPSPASMPSARAFALMEKARSSSRNGGSQSVLGEYGLAVLVDMLRARELEMDGSQVLTNWCNDAIAKHRSFAATLQDVSVMPALMTILQEGRL